MATLPISIIAFKTFSIWSIPTNAVILPIIETTMLFGVLAIFSWNIFKALSYIFFTIVNVQLKYFEMIVVFVQSLHWGQVELRGLVSKILAFTILFLLFVLTIYFYPIKNAQYNYYLKRD